MKIIYITGKTATGKTTCAQKLSELLKIPFYSVDGVYANIAKELNFKNPAQLVMSEKWKEFKNFRNLKEKYYKKLLQDPPDYFILEGFPLEYGQDRVMIERIVGPHKKTFFYLNPSYEDWNELAKLKYGKPLRMSDYEEWERRFEKPRHYYNVKDQSLLFIAKSKYQRVGLTDDKWETLQIDPKDKVIVDLGCNKGWIGKYCLKAGAKKVIGIDKSWQDLERARENGNETILCDFKEELPKVKGDMVLCLALLQHIKDQEQFIDWLATIAPSLVLEMPVNDCNEEIIEVRYGTTFIPSIKLLERWLSKHYNFDIIGKSPSPDNSFRLIYKCELR